jgi:hypothetical protein
MQQPFQNPSPAFTHKAIQESLPVSFESLGATAKVTPDYVLYQLLSCSLITGKQIVTLLGQFAGAKNLQ